MRNKYKRGELVKVNGIGENGKKVKNELGFILMKEESLNHYYVELIFEENDWFKEEIIERVFQKEKNNIKRYQVRLCTTKKGYELIKANIKEKEPMNNNKFKKIDIYRNFKKNDNDYVIIGWKSVLWPTCNKSIKILETTLQKFKILNIPFQYVLLNENEIKDIRIIEYWKRDNNVNVFSIEERIKIKI